MKNSAYSEKQRKIINGEIALETIGTKTALALYNKAIANNDTELAQRAKERLNQSKQESIEKNRERARNSFNNRKHEKFEWSQPKCQDYSEHHKRVIRGEIPYKKIHTKELITIHMIAKSKEDYELSERLFDIIKDRRDHSIQRARIRSAARLPILRQQYEASAKKKLNITVPKELSYLSPIEYALISGEIGFDSLTKDDVEILITKAETHNNEQILRFARAILFYMMNPSELYITQDHKEAIDLLEKQLQLPIRRPESWFEE